MSDSLHDFARRPEINLDRIVRVTVFYGERKISDCVHEMCGSLDIINVPHVSGFAPVTYPFGWHDLLLAPEPTRRITSVALEQKTNNQFSVRVRPVGLRSIAQIVCQNGKPTGCYKTVIGQSPSRRRKTVAIPARE